MKKFEVRRTAFHPEGNANHVDSIVVEAQLSSLVDGDGGSHKAERLGRLKSMNVGEQAAVSHVYYAKRVA